MWIFSYQIPYEINQNNRRNEWNANFLQAFDLMKPKSQKEFES